MHRIRKIYIFINNIKEIYIKTYIHIFIIKTYLKMFLGLYICNKIVLQKLI